MSVKLLGALKQLAKSLCSMPVCAESTTSLGLITALINHSGFVGLFTLNPPDVVSLLVPANAAKFSVAGVP